MTTSSTLDKFHEDLTELKRSFEKLCSQTIQIIAGVEEELANASNDQKE